MAVTDNAATGGTDPNGQPPNALIEATTALLAAVSAITLPLDLPTADPARRARTEIEHILTAAILPRLRTPDAPLLCALAGPTGVGKSTLLNALAGAPVSATGPLRPTTRTPVLVCHPADIAAAVEAGAGEAGSGDELERALEPSVADKVESAEAPEPPENVGSADESDPVDESVSADESELAAESGSADNSESADGTPAAQPGPADEPVLADQPAPGQEPAPANQSGSAQEPGPTDQPAPAAEPVLANELASVDEAAPADQPASAAEPVLADQLASVDESVPADQPAFLAEPVLADQLASVDESVPADQPPFLAEPAPADQPTFASEPLSVDQLASALEPMSAVAPDSSHEPTPTDQPASAPEPVVAGESAPADGYASADASAAATQGGQPRGSVGPGLGARVGAELACLLSSPLPSPSLPRGIALVDTVDGDVAVVEAADVVVVVVSAERYADAAVWRVLRRVSGWGTPIVVVLGRVSAGVVDEVSGAFVELLRVNGLGAVPYFVVEEVRDAAGESSAPAGADGEGARARGAFSGDSSALGVDGGQGESGAEDGGGAPGQGGYKDGGLECAGESAGMTGMEMGDGNELGVAPGAGGGAGESEESAMEAEAPDGESEAGGEAESEARAGESEAGGETQPEARDGELESGGETESESRAGASESVVEAESRAGESESEDASGSGAEPGTAESKAAESAAASASEIRSHTPRLPTAAVAGLHGWLKGAGADTAGRVRIGMLGVAGRLDSVDRLVGELADAWEGQLLALQLLHQGLERVHTAERVRFRGALDGGELLGGEVRIRWQELLGSGRVSSLFGAEDGGGKRRRKRKRADADWSARFHNPTGHDVATAPLRAALVEAVARGHRGALERAARKTVDQWELTPGAPEPGPLDDATRRAIDPARAAAEWLDHLPTVILDQAHSRRTTRTIGPTGAHIRSAALVLGVAALAGNGNGNGSAGGSGVQEGDGQRAYEDPAAEAAVDLLHTMFGEDADRLRTTATTALKDANARLLDYACQPHRAQLAAYTLDPSQAQALAEARAAVARARTEED